MNFIFFTRIGNLVFMITVGLIAYFLLGLVIERSLTPFLIGYGGYVIISLFLRHRNEPWFDARQSKNNL